MARMGQCFKATPQHPLSSDGWLWSCVNRSWGAAVEDKYEGQRITVTIPLHTRKSLSCRRARTQFHRTQGMVLELQGRIFLGGVDGELSDSQDYATCTLFL